MGPRIFVEDTSYKFGFTIDQNFYPTLEQTFSELYTSPLRGFQIMSATGASHDDIIKSAYNNKRRNKYCFWHSNFYHNIAGAANGPTDPKYYSNLSRTRNSLLKEADLASLGNAGLVVHLGSCKDREYGIDAAANTINYILEKTTPLTEKLTKMASRDIQRGRTIFLENGAGQGSYLGCTVDEMAKIYSKIDPKNRSQVKFCIDTAHIHGQGDYDFGDVTSMEQFFLDFDDSIGIEHIGCIHFNDSRVDLGAKKDVHQVVGFGKIFDCDDKSRLAALQELVEKARLEKWPMICEYSDPEQHTWKLLVELCKIKTIYC